MRVTTTGDVAKHNNRKRTYMIAVLETSTEGMISWPLSSCAIPISKVARKDAIMANSDASAKCWPGQRLYFTPCKL